MCLKFDVFNSDDTQFHRPFFYLFLGRAQALHLQVPTSFRPPNFFPAAMFEPFFLVDCVGWT